MPAATRGWCEMHYTRWRRHGDPYETQHEMHGGSHGPEYQIWTAIKSRCLNSNNVVYGYYGGRGIRICEGWRKSFVAFREDVGTRPNIESSIDRINSDGHYSCGYCVECTANSWPANCRWATRSQQSINKGMNRRNRIGLRGVSYHKISRKWRADIGYENKNYYFGYYSTAVDAAYVYDQVAMQLHGSEARLNFEY